MNVVSEQEAALKPNICKGLDEVINSPVLVRGGALLTDSQAKLKGSYTATYCDICSTWKSDEDSGAF